MALSKLFDEALSLLDRRLSLAGSPRFRIVVCGGTALIALGLHDRTTRDVDIVALADDELLAAITWAQSHDPSPGFRECTRSFLQEYGHAHLLDRI